MSALRLGEADIEALERLQERIRRQLDPDGYQREQEERRAAREAAAAERRLEAERQKAQREADRLERERIRLAKAAKVRHCRLCSKPLRRDAAPSTHWCASCLASVKDACPDCGAPKSLDAARCRRCHARHTHQQDQVEADAVGVCLETEWVYKRCLVGWANLDHRHCSCGRPKTADPEVELCGRCMAVELAKPEDGHCKICGCWLDVGEPDAGWEEPEEKPAGRVCGPCQLELSRLVARSAGLLAAAFHTARIEVGGQVTVESSVAI